MDAKLDKDGDLWLKRAGKWKLQSCPYRSDGMMCGDHCPLLLEIANHPGVSNQGVQLHCITDPLHFNIVQDQRPRPSADEKETPEKELDK